MSENFCDSQLPKCVAGVGCRQVMKHDEKILIIITKKQEGHHRHRVQARNGDVKAARPPAVLYYSILHNKYCM